MRTFRNEDSKTQGKLFLELAMMQYHWRMQEYDLMMLNQSREQRGLRMPMPVQFLFGIPSRDREVTTHIRVFMRKGVTKVRETFLPLSFLSFHGAMFWYIMF
jgi:hypothetical protein